MGRALRPERFSGDYLSKPPILLNKRKRRTHPSVGNRSGKYVDRGETSNTGGSGPSCRGVGDQSYAFVRNKYRIKRLTLTFLKFREYR